MAQKVKVKLIIEQFKKITLAFEIKELILECDSSSFKCGLDRIDNFILENCLPIIIFQAALFYQKENYNDKLSINEKQAIEGSELFLFSKFKKEEVSKCQEDRVSKTLDKHIRKDITKNEFSKRKEIVMFDDTSLDKKHQEAYKEQKGVLSRNKKKYNLKNWFSKWKSLL